MLLKLFKKRLHLNFHESPYPVPRKQLPTLHRITMLTKYVLATFQILLVQSLASPKCFDNAIENVHESFATKTPYRFVKNNNDQRIEYPNCTPVKVWGVVRHGSRTPSKKHINKIATDLVSIRDRIVEAGNELCSADVDKFKKWNPQFVAEEAKFLVAEGADEMIELAERMQNRLPEVFPDYFDNNTYKFKFTDTQRTRRSFENFGTGLFGRHNVNTIWYDQPLHRDPVLRFYKLCKRWKRDVDKNPETYKEAKLFRESDIVSNVVTSITKKLGLEPNELHPNDVHLMYMTCAFETAMNKRELSPWCSVFDKHSIRVFEFMEDLEYYWVDGYGYPLTYQQACPAIMDLAAHINPKSAGPATTVYFTHSGTILKLLAKLNLYKDEKPLRYTDFDNERKWRVSKIDAFATSIFFVAFDCGTEGSKLLLLHQERPVYIPGCTNSEENNGTYLCDLDKFLELFKEDIHNCKFDEICKI